MCAAASNVSAQLDRADITLNESARLAVTVTGNGRETVTPPTVPGLQFVAVGQSSQYRSVNGVTTSIMTVTFEVIPQRAGTFTIPASNQGTKTLTLNVRPGNRGRGATTGNSSGPANLPAPSTGRMSAGDTRVTQDGSAFVRLLMPRRELFVGETVPVEIQVGLRPGLVASLNGLPTLNGDEFTLNKLSSEPEQSQEIVGGQPFTVLTWHSALAAVKPGEFSLTVETPLTVRMRTAPQRRSRMPRGLFDDSIFGDPFDDPFFQNFFGGTTEKQITVASEPDALKIAALPTEGRPAGFNGAVGNFEVNSDLSTTKASAGDPITLRLKVTGDGNFDRVETPMLKDVDDWKTYQPTAKFAPADIAGFSGEKVFEQAIIPMNVGKQTVPELAFSYFNPETRRFETKRTSTFTVDVSAASSDGSLAATKQSVSSAEPVSLIDGLLPDHVETGRAVASLRPLYYRPWFVASQGALVICFAGILIVLRRGDRREIDLEGMRQRETSSSISRRLIEMDEAAAAGNVSRFFQSARSALQQKLAARWAVEPASITIAEIDAHMNGDTVDLRRIFVLADQSAYSREQLSPEDLQLWKGVVNQQLERRESP